MEVCKLEDGSILPLYKVQDIIRKMKLLCEAGTNEGDVIALLSVGELLCIAHNPEYGTLDSMEAKLQEFHFLDVEGKMDKTTRDVVKCFSYRDAETETYKLNDDYIAKMLGDS